jgi:hypothetical protein
MGTIVEVRLLLMVPIVEMGAFAAPACKVVKNTSNKKRIVLFFTMNGL